MAIELDDDIKEQIKTFDPQIQDLLLNPRSNPESETQRLNVISQLKKQRQGTGSGLAENIIANTATNVLSNVLTPRQSVQPTGEVPSMPPMYDTSPYRALDIIGAGIGRRPTQEAYFNRMETIQNERLQDEYNRRTDTQEALNLQSLMKETFPNLDENIIKKISPDYISKNYPMIAQMAETKTGTISKLRKDEQAKNMMKEFFPDYKGEVNSENFNIIFSKLSKDAEAEIAKKSKELERQQKIKDDKELLLYKANLDKIKKGSESSSSKNSNLDKTTLRGMMDQESGSVSFINSLKSYHDYIEKNGFNPTDPMIKSRYGDLLSSYKQAKKLGALDAGVLNLFNEVLPNPNNLSTVVRTKFSDDFQKQYFNTVKTLADQTYSSFLDSANVTGYTPTILKESPTWTKSTEANLKDGTYKDDDGKYFKVINGKKEYL